MLPQGAAMPYHRKHRHARWLWMLALVMAGACGAVAMLTLAVEKAG